MLSIAKLLLFFLSSVGIWEIIRRNTTVNVYFLPGLTIAIQTTVLFFGGLWNLLPESAWLLYLIGFAGLVYSLQKDKSLTFLKSYLNEGFFFLAVTMCFMFFFLYGKIFVRYDNFSHWALVARKLIEADRFPNFKDSLIMFQEYPLGSTSFVYFFSKFVGTQEYIQMLAQVYVMVASILPVFLAVRKNEIVSTALIFAVTNYFFVYNVTVTSLIVDTLLPLVAMSALMYCFHYCKRGCGAAEILFVSFYLVQLMQTKNSGIFFVLLICGWTLMRMRGDMRHLLKIASVAPPFISLILWQKHCSYVFLSAATSKHAMTIENYITVLHDKPLYEMKTTCLEMLRLSVTWKDVWLTVTLLLIIGVLIHFFAKEEQKRFVGVFVLSACLYTVYQMGTLGMYLFSMPGSEATSLAGSTRYMKTIITAILYLSLILAVRLISCSDLRKLSGIITTSLLFLCFLAHMYFSMGEIRSTFQYTEDASERIWIETVKADYEIPDGETYCILIPKEDWGYAIFLGRYIFQTHSVDAVIVNSTEDMDRISSKYILLYDSDNFIANKWVRDNYPEQFGNCVIVR